MSRSSERFFNKPPYQPPPPPPPTCPTPQVTTVLYPPPVPGAYPQNYTTYPPAPSQPGVAYIPPPQYAAASSTSGESASTSATYPPPPGYPLLPAGYTFPHMMQMSVSVGLPTPGGLPSYVGVAPAVVPSGHYIHHLQQQQLAVTEMSEEEKADQHPIHGNSSTFNINNLLHQNILESEYFRALYQLQTYHEVIDEVHASVKHVEPWQVGTSRVPSTAFCLLLKFMTMRLTRSQIAGLLDTSDSPLVRALGFLYLRYTTNPSDLYQWLEPYLESDEPMHPFVDETKATTVGEYCVRLLTEMNYYGTTLPRIPVPIERKIRVWLLLLAEKKKRRRMNESFQSQGLFAKGAAVRAIWGDADNEPAWYEAEIEGRDEERRDRYWVRFPEYGNSACVDLGDLDLPKGRREELMKKEALRGDRSRSRSRDGSRRERSRSRDRGRSRQDDESGDLMAKVLQSSRDASLAVGRNYCARPASYKGSLSLKQDRHTARQRSRSPPPREGRRDKDRRREGGEGGSPARSQVQTVAVSQEQVERMRRLKERYGDASTGGG